MASKKSSKSVFRKYDTIITSVLLFLQLTAIIFSFNYFVSEQIAEEHRVVNVSARQGILTQAVGKNIFDIDRLVQTFKGNKEDLLKEIEPSVEALKESSNTFEKTLIALDEGGQVIDFDGNHLNVDPVENPAARERIRNTRDLWLPFHQRIDKVLDYIDNGQIDKDLIRDTANYLRANNELLQDEVIAINTELSQESANKSDHIQWVVIGGIIGALLLFSYIIFGALRQLLRVDDQLEKAQRETDSIMKTVNEGLFLVDEDLTLGNQYSSKLESIINQKDIGGKPLADLLEPMVSQKNVSTVRKFIGQLFNPKTREKLIQDLNPLDRVEILVAEEGSLDYETRYLAFNFSRVYEGKNIVRVLASVSDITRQVKLEQRLEQEREQNDQRLAMLSNVLHADDKIMSSFIRHSREVTDNINNILKRPETNQKDLERKAQQMFREIHGLKGEASALKLENFVSLCNNFEDKIEVIQARRALTGNDFLTLTVELEEIINTTDKVDKMLNRLGEEAGSIIGLVGDDSGDKRSTLSVDTSGKTSISIDDHFSKFTSEVANRHGKQIAFKSEGLQCLSSLPVDVSDKVKDIITQFLRNAVVHGIETPQDREQLQKNPTGIVRVQMTEQANGQYLLNVDDDGNGLDIERIRQRAIDKGMYTPQEAADLSKAQLYQLIFSSGFSTASSTGEDAGRGVGMDVIKERVKQLTGKIGIASEPGKYTRFSILLPV